MKKNSDKIHERDSPPFIWAGSYDPILRYGGDKFPLINQLRDMLSGKFRLVLKLTNIYNNLYVNGKCCLVRKSKFGPVLIYPNTRIIEGTDMGYGGSNNYPVISFKEGYCIVEVITNGFPHFELKDYRMDIEILELEKISPE